MEEDALSGEVEPVEEWLVDEVNDVEKPYIILVWRDDLDEWEIDTNLSEIPDIAYSIGSVLSKMAAGQVAWKDKA